MNRQFGIRLTGFVACLAACSLSASAQTITATATFNNAGVVVDLPAPTAQTVVRMFLKATGAPASDYREVHPLCRLTTTRFAGSVFGLKAATGYDLKLTSAAFAADQFASLTTRSDVFPNATGTTYH